MNIDPNKLKQFLTKKQFGGIYNPLSIAFPNNLFLNNNNTLFTQQAKATPKPTQEEFNLWNNAYNNSNVITMPTPTDDENDTITEEPAPENKTIAQNNTTLTDEEYAMWKDLSSKASVTNQKPTENLNLINPYGGFDITSGFNYGAYQAGLGNSGQASLGIGRGLLGLARTTANAYSAGSEQKRGMRSQNNNSIVNYTGLLSKEKGGEVKVSELLTNKFITDSSNPNVEIEENEQVLNSKTGVVSTAVGETHENGGIETNLPAGSKILSDHLTVSRKDAKELSKDLDIKVKPESTYAEILESYSNKIGVKNNIKKEAKLIEKTEKLMSLEENDTKDINAMFLEKDFKKIQEEKEALNTKQQEAFNKIYEKQEASKPKEEQEGVFQDGGELNPEQVFQELLAQGMTEEEALAYMEQQPQEQAPQNDIVAQIKEILAQGESPENILQVLLEQGYSEQEATELIQSALPQMQDGGKTGRGTTAGFYKQVQALADRLGIEPPKINVNAKGAEKDVEWGKMQDFLVQNDPESVESYMRNQPLTNKGMRNLFNTNKEQLKAIGVDLSKNPDSFTPEERLKIQSQLDLNGDFYRDAFKDSKAGYRYPEMGVGTPKTAIKRTDNNITAPLLTDKPVVGTTNEESKDKVSNNRTAIPMFPNVEGMSPSAMLIPRTDQVTFNRIKPTTITPEVAIASANNQSNFAIEQAYLNNPNIAAFASANLLGTTQQSANQAINQADTYNAQAVDKANLYNTQVGDKEQLMNIELANNFERRLFTSLGNQESDWNRFFTQNQLQNKQNWMDVNNLNLNNAMFPNYQSDGTNVYFTNPTDFNSEQRKAQTELNNFYKLLTPQQQMEIIKRNNTTN